MGISYGSQGGNYVSGGTVGSQLNFYNKDLIKNQNNNYGNVSGSVGMKKLPVKHLRTLLPKV